MVQRPIRNAFHAFSPELCRLKRVARALLLDSKEPDRLWQASIQPGRIRPSTSDDGTTKVWDLASGQELFTLYGHDMLVYGVDFSPDDRLLATASPDGTVAVHLLPIDEFVELARSRVGRMFTHAECRQDLHGEQCPRIKRRGD